MQERSLTGTSLVVIALIGILAGSVWFAAQGWTGIDGPGMPVAGYVAMGAGILLSLVVGVGLMALLFYSRRHGYDDAASRGHGDSER
jgi:hypothetical protein